MKKTLSQWIFLLLVTTTSAVFAIETHCDKEEQIIFNCKLANSRKIVSACKIGPEPQEKQYLQYRFGAPGKVELVFPKQGFVEVGQFFYERAYSNNASYLRYDLTFNIGRNKYNIYSEDTGEFDDTGNQKKNWIANGINVTTSNGKSIDLRCDKNAVDDFDTAYWLYNVIHDDQQ